MDSCITSGCMLKITYWIVLENWKLPPQNYHPGKWKYEWPMKLVRCEMAFISNLHHHGMIDEKYDIIHMVSWSIGHDNQIIVKNEKKTNHVQTIFYVWFFLLEKIHRRIHQSTFCKISSSFLSLLACER